MSTQPVELNFGHLLLDTFDQNTNKGLSCRYPHAGIIQPTWTATTDGVDVKICLILTYLQSRLLDLLISSGVSLGRSGGK